jgi:transposase
MANSLNMAIIDNIFTLDQDGWSIRRIARTLGIHRDTVARHLRQAKQAGAPTGSDPTAPEPATSASEPGKIGQAPTGSDQAVLGLAGNAAESSKLGQAPTGSADEASNDATSGSVLVVATNPVRQPSLCEPFRALIQAQVEQGLSAQRIFQDLVTEHHFTGQYPSVRRFVRRLSGQHLVPFRRMECAPGQEVQVDFGTGAPIQMPDGQRRRTHVFRMVLSYSRKGYSEAVYRQTTDTFLRCLENGFAHFGGVPRTVVLDNLKAGVLQPDWYDPELNPKLRAFADHYGVAILPTRPATPRHKGKIESGVGYVKGNGLKGQIFPSLEEENRQLLHWETTVADTRIHGTTRQQVQQMFETLERPALRPLPLERFPCFQEGQRSVHRDGHVEVAKAYYSVPPEYLGRRLWVRWDGRLVRVFNERLEQIAVHVQREPGRFSTQTEHIVTEKISGVERGAAWLLGQISRLGPHSRRWGENVIAERGVEGVRVLQGLLSLSRRHPVSALERACEVADSYGSYRLRTVRTLITRQAPLQEQFAFMQEHAVIRPLEEYSQFAHNAFQKEVSHD